MEIKKACLEAKKKGRGITRHSWMPQPITILPTNTEDCCLILSNDGRKIAKWNPRLDDLIADDWIVYG